MRAKSLLMLSDFPDVKEDESPNSSKNRRNTMIPGRGGFWKAGNFGNKTLDENLLHRDGPMA